MRGTIPHMKARSFGKSTAREGFALGDIKIYREVITISKVC